MISSDLPKIIPLFGSLMNALFIICGASVGLILSKKISARVMELPIQGMALFVMSLGFSMAITTSYPLVVITSIAIGSIMGEFLELEGRFENFCKKIENCCGNIAKGFSAGFITASIIYCTGSLAVLGSFEEGLGNYPSLLLSKGLIDGLTSIALAASLGFGVLFSAIPVFLYQGILTLLTTSIHPFISTLAIVEMSATGGLMLIAIGLNLLKLTKIRVMNMLPGLILAVFLVQLFIA
ncbi:MAG: DUF554 domain-containing protein [Synergistaceae bacterium]|nr:DUF554 domain-containing protein [Synergistaceae bacterium]